MAATKCEACEGPGKKRRNGWVLCNRCKQLQQNATEPGYPQFYGRKRKQ